MKLKMYTVYDSKAEAYKTPFVMESRGVCLRGFSDVVNDPNTEFNKHPADFTLFEIAEFCPLSGNITMYESKVNLGTALELKTNLV